MTFLDPKTLNINISDYGIEWEMFVFYHEEKLDYKLLLPSGKVWHLSPLTKFRLLQYESPLVCNTRKNMSEQNINTYDFREESNNLQDEDIIEAFFMITFPKYQNHVSERLINITIIIDKYVSNIAPKILKSIEKNISLVNYDDINEVCTVWNYVKLFQLLHKDIPYNCLEKLALCLFKFPHTLYEFNNEVDLSFLSKNHWEETNCLTDIGGHHREHIKGYTYIGCDHLEYIIESWKMALLSVLKM